MDKYLCIINQKSIPPNSVLSLTLLLDYTVAWIYARRALWQPLTIRGLGNWWSIYWDIRSYSDYFSLIIHY